MDYNILDKLNSAPIGILIFSKDYVVTYINASLENLGELYNFPFSNLLSTQFDESELWHLFSLDDHIEELKNGYGFQKEIKSVQSSNGSTVNLLLKCTPAFDNKKNFDGGIIVFEDFRILAETNDELKSQSQFGKTFLKNFPGLVFVTNRFGNIVLSGGNRLTRIPVFESELFNIEITSIFNSDFALTEKIEQVKTELTQQSLKLNLTLQRENLIFDCNIYPHLTDSGLLDSIYFFLLDITSSEEEKNLLIQNSKHYDQYKIANSLLGYSLIILSENNLIKYLDEGCSDIFMQDFESINQKPLTEIFKEITPELLIEIRTELQASDIKKLNPIWTFGDIHKTVELNFIKSTVENELLIYCSDITEKRLAEKEIKNSQMKLMEIINDFSEAFCEIDKDGKIASSNKSFQDIIQLKNTELSGKDFFSIVDPSSTFNSFDALKGFIKNETVKIELNLLGRNEIKTEVTASFVSKFDSQNNLHCIFCFLKDNSANKKIESQLSFYQSLFNSAFDGMAVESEGRIIIANNAFSEIFGYELSNQLENKDILDLVSNDDILKVAEYFRLRERNKDAPHRFEFLAKRKDKSFFYAEISVARFEKDNNVYLVIIARDVTERKRAQKAIRESEEKYRSITENIDDFLFTFERSGKLLLPVFYTSSVDKITGYSQTEFLSDGRLFIKIIHPDDFSTLKKKLRNLLKSKIQETGEFELRIISKFGNVVWVRIKVNLVRNDKGIIQKIYGLVSDITYRKKAEEELKKSTENLLKVSETKDRFLSIVSHDLRTPFSSILGFTDLLLNDEELSDEERKQYVRYIQDSSNSMLHLVNSLLDWTRLQAGRIKYEPQKISAAGIIKDALTTITGSAIVKKITVSSSVGDEVLIFADRNLIYQVFNNLLSNSVKFTSAGGKIIISGKRAEEPRFIEFSVKDDGVGIKPENIKKLFSIDSKFTSEGTAGEKGSGLGLSLVKEIIEKHGGEISVSSEFGAGTEFRFTLPVASSKILLVDDNKTDRLLYTKILRSITPEYEVEIASNGKEAIEKIIAETPALVISDHAMPEMNGIQLVKEISRSEVKGKPPLIILSSDVDLNLTEYYHELGIENVFRKPVNISVLKQAVEKSLRKGLSGN